MLDVLVVGAGPTGLSLAITLRRYGVTVRVVDRAAQPSTVSKALAIWSASLEAMEGFGVVEPILSAGVRLNRLSVGIGARELGALRVGDGIDSPYPYPLLIAQSRTEALLTDRLSAMGVAIERSLELTAVAQDGTGVVATLRRPDGGMDEVRAQYLVGADGARSTVRHALDIAFEGYTEPHTFLLGDVTIDGGDLDHRSIYLRWHGDDSVALFPFENDVWRVFVKRDEGGGDEPPTVEELQRHVDRAGLSALRLSDPRWLSMFRINERLAARYRQGRCFLAGDAAHIHSPAGGQGMNTGIQDAVNLGWKLAHALARHGDGDLLLDSYEAERRPVAAAVVREAARKLHATFASPTPVRLLRPLLARVMGASSTLQRKLQIELSETAVTYRDGGLVRLGQPPRKARRSDVGSRARDLRWTDPETGEARTLWPVLGGTAHTLLLFGEESETAAPEALASAAGGALRRLRLDRRADPDQSARARYRMGGPGWVLIRPDQVIAARGTAGDTATLGAYIDAVLKPAAASG